MTTHRILLAVGATLLLPGSRALDAQSAGDARAFTMVYLTGADTIGVERVTMDADGWTGDLHLAGQPRLRWTQRTVEAGDERTLRIDAWRPGAKADDDPAQRLTLRVRGDTAFVFARDAAGSEPGPPRAALATRRGASWLVNQSLAHAAWLAEHTRSAGRDTAWVVLASGAQQLPALLARDGAALRLTIAGVSGTYHVSAGGQPDSVLVPAQRLRGVVLHGLTGEAAWTRLARRVHPDVSYDAPVDAPYLAEQATVPTPMGHTLAATLTRPRSIAGRVPVVVTISGSGAQERDEAIPGVEGYRPFRQVADSLGRHGIAVLRFDDRGAGESGGDHASATSRDFADDVRALVAWLRARPDIDPDRIVLLGHSEGGLIAPLVAADDPRLAGIALLAGPAYTGARIIAFQQRSAIAQQYPSAFAAARDSLFRVAQAQLDSIARTSPWIREFLTYDPLPTVARVRVPVLVLQGETDLQVTPEQADTLGAVLRAAGNARVSVRRLPATNHLFQRDASGEPSGYGALPDRRVTSETLGIVVAWVREVVAR